MKKTKMKPQSYKYRYKKYSQYSYKGIRKRQWGKWVSEIHHTDNSVRIWLGSYDTPEEAARAHDAAVFCLRGPSSPDFNFPDDLPQDIPSGELSRSQIQMVAARHAGKATELKQPSSVVENLFSEGSSKSTEFMGGKGDTEEKEGEVFDTSRIWDFGFDTSRRWDFGFDTSGSSDVFH